MILQQLQDCDCNSSANTSAVNINSTLFLPLTTTSPEYVRSGEAFRLHLQNALGALDRFERPATGVSALPQRTHTRAVTHGRARAVAHAHVLAV
eukprot:6191365-Pleurochrysis_carterae.AAC.1